MTRLNSLQAARTQAISPPQRRGRRHAGLSKQICPLENSRLSHLANGHHGRSGC
jgi:hypothetical protein